ncbi:MAG: 30S ribosomal protein S8, partial [Syntrophobacterales bacterium]|nr:30S ribosomal protein S8 [Syntrophobacterales bacterium]
MGMTDPVADMLTRIRNANRMKFKNVDVLLSRVNLSLAKVLKDAGYINGFDVRKGEKKPYGMLKIHLGYSGAKDNVITGIQRVSKPGRRVYSGSQDIPKVLNGYGVAILSTSKGIMTDKQARALNVGGEILCNV